MRGGQHPIERGKFERWRDDDGSSQPSPDGSNDQRDDETFASGEVLLVVGMSCPSIRIVTSCRSSCPHGEKAVQSFEKAFIDAIENVQTDITKLQILLGA